jgi:PPOX class probable F420-dependent enzyme
MMVAQTWADDRAGPAAFAPLIRQRNALLTTYRRDSTPKGTPVHIAVEGDRAYFRTWDATWKLRRLRRNPNGTVAPSTARGAPLGPAIAVRARILNGEEATHAAHALGRKYPILHGMLIPRFHRLRGYTTVHLELTPRDDLSTAV